MPFVACCPLQVMTSDTNPKKKVEIWPAIIIHNGKHIWCDTKGTDITKKLLKCFCNFYCQLCVYLGQRKTYNSV